MGVSRCGKTRPACSWPVQFGLKVADYRSFPKTLKTPSSCHPRWSPTRKEAFWPDHSAPSGWPAIRSERRPGLQRYASLPNCRYEVAEAEAMMRRSRHPVAVHHHQVDRRDCRTILQELLPDG